jgi:UDP-N-acetylmuramoylalanine--D-glutamate ligase
VDLNGRRVTVVGLGVSGFAAARALLGLGAKVYVTDSASDGPIQERAAALRAVGAAVDAGRHDVSKLDCDLAVVSPGVPPWSDTVEELRRRGVGMIGEVELAFRLSACDFLAVTGTNGKTTTTSLLAAMLQEGGIKCVPAGNIGFPLIDAIASIPEDAVIALEVSSFQLETIDCFRPQIAILLNIAEDHIDWHGSLDAYVAAKARIVENQTSDDIYVYNVDDSYAREIARWAPGKTFGFSGRGPVPDGIGVSDYSIAYRGRDLVDVADVSLPGIPGLEDVAAAAGAALEYGVEQRAVIRAIKGFRPLRHRLEVVGELDGVTYINDSKATNPHAALAAVEDLKDVVLIAGGRSKGIDLSPLADTVPPVRSVVALGEAAAEVERVFQNVAPVKRATSMAEAVTIARGQSVAGGSVLLSPGCASLDMFESYSARGEAFVRAVEELMESEQQW